MVWNRVPGANVARGAEGDNNVEQVTASGTKRSTYPSQYSAFVPLSAEPVYPLPYQVAAHSSRAPPCNADRQYLAAPQHSHLRMKNSSGRGLVNFNSDYAPELAMAAAFARGESNAWLSRNWPNLFDKDQAQQDSQAHFTAVPGLLNDMGHMKRLAPSMPAHLSFADRWQGHRSPQRALCSPDPAWYCYGENKGINVSPQAPRPSHSAEASCQTVEEAAIQTEPAGHSTGQHAQTNTEAVSSDWNGASSPNRWSGAAARSHRMRSGSPAYAAVHAAGQKQHRRVRSAAPLWERSPVRQRPATAWVPPGVQFLEKVATSGGRQPGCVSRPDYSPPRPSPTKGRRRKSPGPPPQCVILDGQVLDTHQSNVHQPPVCIQLPTSASGRSPCTAVPGQTPAQDAAQEPTAHPSAPAPAAHAPASSSSDPAQAPAVTAELPGRAESDATNGEAGQHAQRGAAGASEAAGQEGMPDSAIPGGAAQTAARAGPTETSDPRDADLASQHSVDSLTDLERLIEEQHQQLVAKGVLPVDAESGIFTADLSDLSLDQFGSAAKPPHDADRIAALDRLADSLASGLHSEALLAATRSKMAQLDANSQLGYQPPAVTGGRDGFAADAGLAADRTESGEADGTYAAVAAAAVADLEFASALTARSGRPGSATLPALQRRPSAPTPTHMAHHLDGSIFTFTGPPSETGSALSGSLPARDAAPQRGSKTQRKQGRAPQHGAPRNPKLSPKKPSVVMGSHARSPVLLASKRRPAGGQAQHAQRKPTVPHHSREKQNTRKASVQDGAYSHEHKHGVSSSLPRATGSSPQVHGYAAINSMSLLNKGPVSLLSNCGTRSHGGSSIYSSSLASPSDSDSESDPGTTTMSTAFGSDAGRAARKTHHQATSSSESGSESEAGKPHTGQDSGSASEADKDRSDHSSESDLGSEHSLSSASSTADEDEHAYSEADHGYSEGDSFAELLPHNQLLPLGASELLQQQARRQGDMHAARSVPQPAVISNLAAAHSQHEARMRQHNAQAQQARPAPQQASNVAHGGGTSADAHPHTDSLDTETERFLSIESEIAGVTAPRHVAWQAATGLQPSGAICTPREHAEQVVSGSAGESGRDDVASDSDTEVGSFCSGSGSQASGSQASGDEGLDDATEGPDDGSATSGSASESETGESALDQQPSLYGS